MNLLRVRQERVVVCCFRAGISIVCLLTLASCRPNPPIRLAESPVPPQSLQKPNSNPSGKPVIDLAKFTSFRYAAVASVGSMEAGSKANKALQSAKIASYIVGSQHTFKIQVREQDRARSLDVLKANSQANHYVLVLSP